MEVAGNKLSCLKHYFHMPGKFPWYLLVGHLTGWFTVNRELGKRSRNCNVYYLFRNIWVLPFGYFYRRITFGINLVVQAGTCCTDNQSDELRRCCCCKVEGNSWYLKNWFPREYWKHAVILGLVWAIAATLKYLNTLPLSKERDYSHLHCSLGRIQYRKERKHLNFQSNRYGV